jgi:primosomal protein N''
MQHTLERLSFPSVRSFRFDRVHQTAHRTAPRFSRRLFGADPREVSQYLVEVDQATQNLVEALEHELHELEAHLRACNEESLVQR